MAAEPVHCDLHAMEPVTQRVTLTKTVRQRLSDGVVLEENEDEVIDDMDSEETQTAVDIALRRSSVDYPAVESSFTGVESLPENSSPLATKCAAYSCLPTAPASTSFSYRLWIDASSVPKRSTARRSSPRTAMRKASRRSSRSMVGSVKAWGGHRVQHDGRRALSRGDVNNCIP